ncbi:MAG: methylenetetrahydrofolate--tRNA-(uracil-5-)-methyltransferase TrmFO [Myxococcales bacterium]
MTAPVVHVVGGGLAGCEAAWQLATLGLHVQLHEMRPHRRSPAHQTDGLAELVCSNSFRSRNPDNAVGLIKQELRAAGSLILGAADANAVPAGDALAVDRDAFSAAVASAIDGHPRIHVVREEVTSLPDAPTIIATGPLTSDALAARIVALTGSERLYFYDAIAPIVDADSLDRARVFAQSRYDKGGDDYLNCPLDQDQYHAFVRAILDAEKVPLRDFEEPRYFQGCLPIEVIAASGPLSLAFGPMKPVGLVDPLTGHRPFAVVQLRRENAAGTAYNLVGFQTKLKYPEQGRIFRTIPGLEGAEFLRYGSVHRNTYIHGPRLLDQTLRLRADERLTFAGQITGVEGYVESTACGLLAGLFLGARLRGEEPPLPPAETALGALHRHVTCDLGDGYQPTNVNYSLFPAITARARKGDKKTMYRHRAEGALLPWLEALAALRGDALRHAGDET